MLRIIDTPPKSRNEKLASLMRRLKMCEKLGRGWDRMVLACEAQFDALTNKSLRDRFGIPETSSSSSSRLIKEAINKGLIKVLDPNTASRYMKYIPIWA